MHVDAYRSLGGGAKEFLSKYYILVSQHTDIGPQCHFPQAVGMKVELIFLKVIKMFDHGVVLFQAFPIFHLAFMAGS